jgi:hypothetical protein
MLLMVLVRCRADMRRYNIQHAAKIVCTSEAGSIELRCSRPDYVRIRLLTLAPHNLSCDRT